MTESWRSLGLKARLVADGVAPMMSPKREAVTSARGHAGSPTDPAAQADHGDEALRIGVGCSRRSRCPAAC